MNQAFLRCVHNLALGLGWLPWPVLPPRLWPAIHTRPKRGITAPEHQRIIAAERNPETRRYYELVWETGASQSDAASLRADNIDWPNRLLSYRRIAGALNNLRHEVSHQTVANILKRHGLEPAPEREKKMTWREFIRSHTEVVAAVDFFTAEVWTGKGLMTYYVMTFMGVSTRQVCIAGVTTSPDSAWMQRMARNMTLADTGFLGGCRYLLHDRDAKFCVAFDGILESVGIQAATLPPHSPNLNAHCERWIKSVKSDALSKLNLFGEASLRHVLSNHVEYHHSERNHQGKGNVILFPKAADRVSESSGEILKRERLGGLLQFHHREAA